MLMDLISRLINSCAGMNKPTAQNIANALMEFWVIEVRDNDIRVPQQGDRVFEFAPHLLDYEIPESTVEGWEVVSTCDAEDVNLKDLTRIVEQHIIENGVYAVSVEGVASPKLHLLRRIENHA